MFYGDRSHYLAASDDGLHWDERLQCVFDRRSDAAHTLTYDETRRNRWAMRPCRASGPASQHRIVVSCTPGACGACLLILHSWS